MDKYNKKINIVVGIPGMSLTSVPLSSYDIDEWIGKCEDIEVLKYLSRILHKRIACLEDNDWDYDIMR